MEDSRRLFAIILFLALSTGLFAQDQDEALSDYWYEERDGKAVFMQVIKWEAVQYSTGYLLAVDRKDPSGVWLPFTESKTEKNHSVVSLPPGEYRYKITVYDILGKAAAVSQWFPLSVEEAVQPVLSEVSPDLIYLEERNTGIVAIKAVALLDSAILELRNLARPGLKYPVIVVASEPKKRSLKIRVPIETIELGAYALYAENPGGLSALSDPVTIKFKKPRDLDLSLGYQPLFVLFDDAFATYFDSWIIPLGASAKITYIPFKRAYGFFGLGAILSAARTQKDFDLYRLSTNYLSGHLTLAFQRPLVRQVLNLDLHAGAGAAMLNNLRFQFDNGISSPSFSPWGPSYLAGLDLHWYPLRRMYVDFGLDFSVSPLKDVTLGILAPSVTAGWQF